MDVLDSKTDTELVQAAIAETAKARSEINTAQKDIAKAVGRLGFLLVIENELKERLKEK